MIPSILWQTAKNADEVNLNFIKSWMFNSPALDLRFMDDIACENFIRDNFSDEVFFVYTSLPLGIMRADMWRIAIVYINGGVYADTDVMCLNDVTPLLNANIVLCQETHDRSDVSNYFFAAEKNHPILKRALDCMVESFYRGFNADEPLLVQNFGMHSFQIAVDEHKANLIPKDVISNYMVHVCHGSWRESELNYKQSKHMKPITFFTTFNENGYLLYGKTWISTFIKNVAPKSVNIKAKIYKHGFDLHINHPQIEVIDFDEALPTHNDWKSEFQSKSTYSNYVGDMTVRFSHKGFVIQHALDNINTGIAIWLDGDCVMHDYSYDTFANDVLYDKVLACQVEGVASGHNHVESGVLIFDTEHKDIDKFREQFKLNYTVDELLKMSEPYDGFVVYKSIKSADVEFNNLNENYGVGGIQSDPSLTFLHPEIKARFTHNIGMTGKSQYEAWDILKQEDKVFSIVAGVSLQALSGKNLEIHNMKKKRALAKIRS